MALVHLSGELRRHVGGHSSVQIDAPTVLDLVAALEARFPEVIQAGLRGMAVAINGEITPHADYERLKPDSEIHFVAAISGG